MRNTTVPTIVESLASGALAELDERVQLPDIQGNVLKAYRRHHAFYLFVRFDAKTVRGNPALRSLFGKHVSSAARQNAMSAEWRRLTEGQQAFPATDGSGPFSDPAGMFALTASGYRHFGIAGGVPISDELGDDIWKFGMRPDEDAVPPYYWRSSPEQWEKNYKEEIHGLFLLADDSLERLLETRRAFKRELSTIGVVVAEERGARLLSGPRGAEGDIEHFGFKDGMSKVASPSAVFTPEDPWGNGAAGKQTFGCFATFLKIEQNVLAFEQESAALGAAVCAKGITISKQQAQELAVGRTKDGSLIYPLVDRLNGRPIKSPGAVPFAVKGASAPIECPHHAHIRVMNGQDHAHQIALVRRGMVYGTDLYNEWTQDGIRQLPPSAGAGLLFLSFQRSLRDFTALISRAYKRGDPILTHKHYVPDGQTWDFAGKKIAHTMAGMTTIRGGEYFYVPSMPFLEYLSS